MNFRIWIILGGLLGATGVAAGAYAAHGLSKALEARGVSGAELAHDVANFDTAARYQMIHAVAIVLTGILARQSRSRWWNVAGGAYLLGVLMFSGGLYGLVFDVPEHWAIVPLGGLSFMVGWIALAIGGALAAQKESASAGN